MPRTFGLIDGNSFYCSCERAFSPRLRGRAVVVLSNNDGCAVARTCKAKAAGIKMDRPYTPTDNGGALAFITDPWGTSIELNERPNPVYLP